MDQETEKIIKERYQLLPVDTKRALKSIPLSEIMEKIAEENGLHIDQSGDLYTETLLVLLGIEPIENFEKNIKNNLKIDAVVAHVVTQNINDKVSLAIRENLKEMAPTEKESFENSSMLNSDSRENILAEIENPTPAVHPISIADQTVPGPAKPREIINVPTTKVSAETNTLENVGTRDTVASEFIAGKLTETVSLPSQRINVTPDSKDGPKNYTNDPYREPIK
ncbi:MAG: hypothetical protein AAB484_00885 [Patescibacteria group bacterium]